MHSSFLRVAKSAAVVAVVAFGFVAEGFASDWTYSNKVITEVGGEGLEMNVTLSGTELTLSSVKSAGTGLIFDLRGRVTDATSGTEYTIVALGGSFLRSKSNVDEIYLPDTLRTIGNTAFYQCTISKIEPFLPASVTTFTGQDFNACTFKGDLVLSNPGITSIPASCFYNSKITSVDLSGTSLSTVGGSAFRGCSNLKRIVLPPSFVSFADAGFMASPIEEVTFNALIPSNFLNNNQWSSATSFKVRFIYDPAKGKWTDFIATESSFVPWENAGSNQKTYFDKFGQDADIPTGYIKIATPSKYAWLVKTTSMLESVDLTIEGSPSATAEIGFSPAYGEHLAIQDQIPLDVIAPEHAYLGDTAYVCAGYSLQKYNADTEEWVELSHAATNALKFVETANGKYNVCWSWIPAAYKVRVPFAPKLGELSMTPPDFDGAYYSAGKKVVLSATPSNGVTFCWWKTNGVKVVANPLELRVAGETTVANYMRRNWVVTGDTMCDGYWTVRITKNGSEVTAMGVATQPTNHGGMLDLRKPIEGDFVLVAVDGSAFREKSGTDLSCLTLPDTIRTIGNAAFYKDTSLTEVEPFFPKSLTYVGGKAFENDPITNALVLCNPAFSTFDNGEESVFNGARFVSADFRGSAVTSLGSSALRANTKLSAVYFGDRFTTFANACLYGCSNLKEFHFAGAPPKMVDSVAFNSVPLATKALKGVVVYPADNEEWAKLIATNETVKTLTSAEKQSFRESFPQLVPAKRKFKLIGTTVEQYLTIERALGMRIVFR